MSDEEMMRQFWGNRIQSFEGGDGCHIEINGIEHPHFYGNVPSHAWRKVAEWTIVGGSYGS